MKARGKDWTPTGNVRHEPVPFTLLEVAQRFYRDGSEEVVAAGHGDYTGVPFDPWRRGDLVVLCETHSSTAMHGKTTRCETFRVTRRASTPAAKVACYADSDEGPVTRAYNAARYRIAYRYLTAAEKLIGREFASKKELETALKGA